MANKNLQRSKAIGLDFSKVLISKFPIALFNYLIVLSLILSLSYSFKFITNCLTSISNFLPEFQSYFSLNKIQIPDITVTIA